MPIKFPDGNGGITLIGSDVAVSNYFEDEVSLHGGVRIWDRFYLNQNTSVYAHTGGYWDFTGSTINANNNLHYIGNHVFDDNIKFAGKVTLQGGAAIQDDVTFNDSLDIDCGRYALIDARHDTIKLTNSTISGNHTVDGNAYYQGVHCFTDEVSLKSCTVSGNHTLEGNAYHYGINRFYDDASFEKGVKFYDKASLLGGVKVGTGLIMQGDTLHAVQSTTVILDTVPSTVEGAMWYVL